MAGYECMNCSNKNDPLDLNISFWSILCMPCKFAANNKILLPLRCEYTYKNIVRYHRTATS